MLRIKFIICLMVVSAILVAQKQPEHKKRFYMSQDGKLYCNKYLPIYFWISTSPNENAEKHRLKSETTPKYSNPMYFDTDGRNTFRSPSAVDTITYKVVEPRMDVEYQVYADGVAPVSKWGLNSKMVFENKSVYFINTKEINITTSDDLSGVDGTMYSLDSAAYVKYSSNITLNAEKEYVFKFYSYDYTGNTENVKVVKICLDQSSPISELKFEGDKYNDVISGNTYVNIAANDNLSGVKKIFYAIDDTIYKVYSGKLFSGNMSQGQHTIHYFAIDNVENKELLKSVEFYVDKTPPQVLEEIVGKTFYVNGKEFSAGTSRLKVSAIDNKAGVKEISYSINNGPLEKYDKPLILSSYKGNLIVKCFAIDNVGNKGGYNTENNRNNSIPYVDIIAPWVGYSFSGPIFKTRDTTFISNKTGIVLQAKDDESGVQKIEYQIDTMDLALYQKPLNLPYDKYHSITMYGYDNTDNLTRQEFSVMIDTVGPQIFDRFSVVPLTSVVENNVTVNEYPSYAVLFISATDFCVGYESLTYKVNNLPWQNYGREISGFVANSLNTVIIRAVDKLGNKTEKTIRFKIK
jgi:hypothetical protein